MHIYLDTMNIEVVDLEATPMFCLVICESLTNYSPNPWTRFPFYSLRNHHTSHI
jgi:hypothetical protein